MAIRASAKSERFARRSVALVIVTLGVAALVSACLPEGRFCSPGDFLRCTTAGGAAGAAMCNDDGTAYGPCDPSLLLDGSLPPAPDASTDASAGDGGLCSGTSGLAVTCPCTSNSDCASNDCYPFPSRGLYCTESCTRDSDCPPPSPGCTPKGFCKVP